jgi:hypothetical protein
MSARIWCGILLLASLPGCFGREYVEPDQAGRDYELQGEYANESYGVQVIARGSGRFLAVLHEGGLPGAGAKPGVPAAATGRDDGEAVPLRGDFDGTLKDGTLRLQPAGGQSSVLRRVERQSPTLGAAPPPGAVVLFGGPDLGAFAEAKLDPRGFLAAGARTRERFGSFMLHLEFRTPFMPDARGQFRGNSGVYLQDRYEIQVLDSFGLAVESNDCGAIYEQHAAEPNMTFPPLVWQTYDIEFQTARFDANGAKTADAVVSVRHNGVLVQDHVALAGPTGRGQAESLEPGPLVFQDHWNPVVYRNIWLVPR